MRKLRTLVALSAAAATFALASPAGAADCPFSTPDAGGTECSSEVKPVELPGSGGDPVAPVPAPAAKASLPVTGAETLVLAGVGSGMILAGGLLVMRSRQSASV